MTALGLGIGVPFSAAPRSVAFNPLTALQAYGLTGYWDAALEITPAGGPVAGWGDSNSADATRTWNQGTGANQPVIIASGTPSGKPTVKFVDSTDALATTGSGSIFFSTTAKTMWIVLKPPQVVGVTFSGIIGDSAARFNLAYQESTGLFRMQNNDGATDSVTVAANKTGFNVLEARHDGVNVYLRSGNNAEASTPSGTSLAFGATMQIKFSADLSGMEIADIIFCNQVPPDNIRQQVRNHYLAKHGI